MSSHFHAFPCKNMQTYEINQNHTKCNISKNKTQHQVLTSPFSMPVLRIPHLSLWSTAIYRLLKGSCKPKHPTKWQTACQRTHQELRHEKKTSLDRAGCNLQNTGQNLCSNASSCFAVRVPNSIIGNQYVKGLIECLQYLYCSACSSSARSSTGNMRWLVPFFMVIRSCHIRTNSSLAHASSAAWFI